EVNMYLQARFPPALAAIHNFIWNHDPQDIDDVEVLADLDPGARTGELADGITRAAEREWANCRQDDIAQQMWAQYLVVGCILLNEMHVCKIIIFEQCTIQQVKQTCSSSKKQ